MKLDTWSISGRRFDLYVDDVKLSDVSFSGTIDSNSENQCGAAGTINAL